MGIMGPLHWMYGECAGIEDQPLLCHGKADHMSYLSFGNVRNGSWLYFVHSMIVWGVVLTVTHKIFQKQAEFVELRYAWLWSMAEVRANTVLVEEIPENKRSQGKLRTFFREML